MQGEHMNNLQQEILNEMNVRPTIDPEEEFQSRTAFLVDNLKQTGRGGYVLGISGGQDSLVAGKITQTAVETAREDGLDVSFHAVLLPYGEQRDRNDAISAIDFISPDVVHDLQIKPSVDAFETTYNRSVNPRMSDFDKGNLKARTRMAAQYAIASHFGLLVIGTDHAVEAVTGFFTKHGDGAADILPLAGLNKRQGRQILRFIDAPDIFATKDPTADLLDQIPGQTDEAELGIAIEQIDDYLEGREIDEEAARILEEHYITTRHKRAPPVAYGDVLRA